MLAYIQDKKYRLKNISRKRGLESLEILYYCNTMFIFMLLSKSSIPSFGQKLIHKFGEKISPHNRLGTEKDEFQK